MEIKLLVIDVDGTLTDGKIYYGNNDVEIKAFNAKDGALLKPLPFFGIRTVFLTGRKSEAVLRRATDLNAMAIQGIENKFDELRKLMKEYCIEPVQCAYIGDDLNDYSAMKICGFKACPADAAIEIKSICDYVSEFNGGHGAVRDICTFILQRDGKYDKVLDFYH